MMVKRKAEVIVLRRSVVVRLGTAVTVVAALGIGYAIGLGIDSPPHSSNAVATARSSTKPITDPATVSNAVPTAAPADPAPTVLSCEPGSKPQVRPTLLYIGCRSGDITMTAIAWSSWGGTGGSGSGNLQVNSCRPSCATGSVSGSPAFVVVSNPVDGVFRDVLITPPSGVVAQQSSSQPGTGWGSG
jgi:hypothetical protein